MEEMELVGNADVRMREYAMPEAGYSTEEYLNTNNFLIPALMSVVATTRNITLPESLFSFYLNRLSSKK